MQPPRVGPAGLFHSRQYHITLDRPPPSGTRATHSLDHLGCVYRPKWPWSSLSAASRYGAVGSGWGLAPLQADRLIIKRPWACSRKAI